jgi:hypothetical protein
VYCVNDYADIIFSLRDGRVIASWPDDRTPINLGEFSAVAGAMNDFMRQCEVAARLLETAKKGSGTQSD